VANSERTFPAAWIAENGYDVTDQFVQYAQPLVGEGMVSLPMIGGRQRLTRLKPIFADQKLPAYRPEAERQQKPS
jgi:6-phosphofructokinase 1